MLGGSEASGRLHFYLAADADGRQRKQREELSICHVGICQTDAIDEHGRNGGASEQASERKNYPNRFPNASKLHSIAVWPPPHTTFDFDSITPHHDELSQSAP